MQSACQAVLAHCRSLEVADRDAIHDKDSAGGAGSASSPMDTAVTHATNAIAAGVPATSGANCANGRRDPSLLMDTSNHSAVKEMESPEEQEESQLSSQLHDATLSNPDSPAMPLSDDMEADSCDQDGKNATGEEDMNVCSEQDRLGGQAGAFLYTGQELARLEEDHMSVVLLRVLLGMVCCQGKLSVNPLASK